MAWSGRLEFIHLADKASADMQQVSEGELIAGRGLEGDRYFLGTGQFSQKPGLGRNLTLIEAETLEALKRDHATDLAPVETRRNLTVRGVPLNHLVDKKFKVGAAVIYGARLNTPCKYLESLVGKKLVPLLLNRSGLNCDVIESGTIRPGDVIEPLD